MLWGIISSMKEDIFFLTAKYGSNNIHAVFICLAEKIPANYNYAGVAQSVEQRTENPCVVGSIPTPGIFLVFSGLC